MKFILVLIMCATINGKTTCMPPLQAELEYEDAYSCMLDGYQKSYDKIVEIGKEQVNDYNIYIRFGCNENKSNKTSISSIIIK